MLALLLLPVTGQPQDAAEHIIFDLVVQADSHVLFHGHLVKQADVLEGTGNAQP